MHLLPIVELDPNKKCDGWQRKLQKIVECNSLLEMIQFNPMECPIVPLHGTCGWIQQVSQIKSLVICYLILLQILM